MNGWTESWLLGCSIQPFDEAENERAKLLPTYTNQGKSGQGARAGQTYSTALLTSSTLLPSPPARHAAALTEPIR